MKKILRPIQLIYCFYALFIFACLTIVSLFAMLFILPVEDNETEKKFKENFLVISKDLFSVGDKVEWFYANFKSYEIIGIKKSKITEIINVK